MDIGCEVRIHTSGALHPDATIMGWLNHQHTGHTAAPLRPSPDLAAAHGRLRLTQTIVMRGELLMDGTIEPTSVRINGVVYGLVKDVVE